MTIVPMVSHASGFTERIETGYLDSRRMSGWRVSSGRYSVVLDDPNSPTGHSKEMLKVRPENLKEVMGSSVHLNPGFFGGQAW